MWATSVLFLLLQGALQVAFVSLGPEGKDHFPICSPAAWLQGPRGCGPTSDLIIRKITLVPTLIPSMTTVSLKALPATSEDLGLHGGTTHALSIQGAPGLQQDMEGMGDKEGVSWGL